MKSIEDADLESTNVLLRTDLNLPVEDGEPRKTVRFERYLETIEKLSGEGARTVVMAHQGRPARNDFTSLEKHSEMIAEELGQEVNFVQTFFGPQLGDAVASMQDGDVTVLENIRFLSEELQNASPQRHSHDYFVQNLAPYFDLYVDDAFSAAHRSHASMVGFTELLDSYAGPVMQKEMESCSKVRKEFESGVLVLGGEKPSDIIGMMEHMIEEVEKVLLGGIPGELALKIRGLGSGKKNDWIEKNSFDASADELEALMDRYGEKIIFPEDLRTDKGDFDAEKVPDDEMTWDIGERTAERYAEIIREADAAVMKGPMGAFEDYPDGSEKIVEALADSEGFTVLGGGHTSSLVQRFGYGIEDFSHVSIAGGAFVRYMSGEKLAAIQALE
ncbi:phosphoglycerate kinase [Candidatus Nanosalina sp. VS9-1]|uniref:phosphoglycerate kinase n=1 Tax=Candidatus Nanosalina sp. VS9-1 TaxID=3388566 RepID=UPI0039DFA635